MEEEVELVVKKQLHLEAGEWGRRLGRGECVVAGAEGSKKVWMRGRWKG